MTHADAERIAIEALRAAGVDPDPVMIVLRSNVPDAYDHTVGVPPVPIDSYLFDRDTAFCRGWVSGQAAKGDVIKKARRKKAAPVDAVTAERETIAAEMEGIANDIERDGGGLPDAYNIRQWAKLVRAGEFKVPEDTE